MSKEKQPVSRIVSAVGSASVTGAKNRNSDAMQAAMSAAGLAAMEDGKSDEDILAAKLAARERLKAEWKADDEKAAEMERMIVEEGEKARKEAEDRVRERLKAAQ